MINDFDKIKEQLFYLNVEKYYKLYLKDKNIREFIINVKKEFVNNENERNIFYGKIKDFINNIKKDDDFYKNFYKEMKDFEKILVFYDSLKKEIFENELKIINFEENKKEKFLKLNLIFYINNYFKISKKENDIINNIRNIKNEFDKKKDDEEVLIFSKM